MIESITFNTGENKLVVTALDETFTEYTEALPYLTDYPERSADVIAMGWSILAGWTTPEV